MHLRQREKAVNGDDEGQKAKHFSPLIKRSIWKETPVAERKRKPACLPNLSAFSASFSRPCLATVYLIAASLETRLHSSHPSLMPLPPFTLARARGPQPLVPMGFSLHLSSAPSCCWLRPHYGAQCSWKGREGKCKVKRSQSSCTWKNKNNFKLEECVIN